MVEGTAAQYRFSAPSTFPTMVHAAGGDQAAVAALDSLFTKVNGGLDTPYAWLGNEPGLATPYAYLQAGAPTHTQAVISRIRSRLYTDTPNGIVGGNDDLGSMSSWYVFAALGVSPQGPGLGDFLLSNPLFPYAEVQRAAGNMTISAPHTTPTGSFVQSLTVDGVAHDQTYLSQATVLGGAKLDFTMGSDQKSSWGTAAADAPPTDTQGMPTVTSGITRASDTASLVSGGSQKLTLTVGDLTGSKQDVSWSLKAADGVTFAPSSGTLHSVADGTDAVKLTATSTSTPGVFLATHSVTGADGATFKRSLMLKVARTGEEARRP